MFYHFLAPENGHPHMRGNFIEKKYQTARSFFLHQINLINKNSETSFQNVQQIFIHFINIIFSVILLLSNHEALYNFKNIVLSFFKPINALFTITCLWPK